MRNLDLIFFVGLLLAFGLGCIATPRLLKAIAYRKIGLRMKRRNLYTLKYIVIFSILGGGIAATLFVFLQFILPRELTLVILCIILFFWIEFAFFKFIDKKFPTPSRNKTVPSTTYSTNKPLPGENLERALDNLTLHKIWDWSCFRGVLICLARIGQAHYIPARQRPDQISLDGLQVTFSELSQISTRSNGRETSRAVFVDKERSCLVISGKTHIGTEKSVKIDMETQPGRRYTQLPVLTIHVHPGTGSSEGFSDIDYTSFLSDNRLIVMIICYQGGVLLALKTSATSKDIAASTAQNMISAIRQDILKIWSNLHLSNSIVAFNKAVCMEFGITLYQTSVPENNIAYRIEVTNL